MGFVEKGTYQAVEMLPGIVRNVMASGERAMAVLFELEEGAVLPVHSHPHEQVGFVISGALELTMGGETKLLREREGYTIPPSTEHTAVARSRCEVLDVFAPVREDYL